MRRTAKKRTQAGRTKRNRTVAKTRIVDAAVTIRQIGNDWPGIGMQESWTKW